MGRVSPSISDVTDWLRLLRASGFATIASNLLAASALAFYAGEGNNVVWFLARLWHNGWSCLWVPLTSALLFAAGMVWNDLVDVDRDRRAERYHRPLAGGAIGLVPAYIVGVLLVIGAMLSALMVDRVHYYGLLLAGIVLILSLLYNLVAKTIPWLGALVMGSVRASHAVFAVLLIGADHVEAALLGSGTPGLRSFLVYPLVIFLWTVGLTLAGELEDPDRRGTRLEFLAAGAFLALALGIAVVHLLGAPWLHLHRFAPVAALLGLAVVVWCAWRVFIPWWKALRAARCQGAGSTVVAGLGGIILLDAVLAASAHPVLGVVTLALFPIFLVFSRLVRMA